MSDGQEYKLKRRETLIWHPSGASVEGWEYSNRYGTLSFVPQTATLGDFYTFTYQLLGHSLLYQRDITIYDESETGITETEQYNYLSGNRMLKKSTLQVSCNRKPIGNILNCHKPALPRI